MKIRGKIILIVLPLIITPLVLVGISSTLSARNGITQIATSFLRFKADELEKYAASQWNLLLENGLTDETVYVKATRTVIEAFASSLVRSPTELIIAVSRGGEVVLSTGILDISENEGLSLAAFFSDANIGWETLVLEGVTRVAQVSYFESLDWMFVVTEHWSTFYSSTNRIIVQSVAILSGSLMASVLLLFFFATYLTQPLRGMVGVMQRVIATNNLSEKVEIRFGDEIGELGHTFNIMTEELDKAYSQVKGYALRAVVSQRKEQQIRNIFQRYVPKDVIDRYFDNPAADMLEGESRILAVLFCDIRDFTTISEHMPPPDIVESLNRYFGLMVDIIIERNGIVDKYIGDAIMAFFGAPVSHSDDPTQAAESSLAMIDAIKVFNRWQAERNRPPFRAGIGISYGEVTVGNIGSPKKMDYTVVGDMVNVASRLESLTKVYHEPVLFSESIYSEISDKIPCRMVDRVAVKGRKTGEAIYTMRRSLTDGEKRGWDYHRRAQILYYSREFTSAKREFLNAKQLIPGDHVADIFVARCDAFIATPPDESWTGVRVMEEK